ncbi:MAG TPA: sensor histidine kinase [Nakamurella sp.]|nr:sensor histidine kinase [Nakamurella sp.]
MASRGRLSTRILRWQVAILVGTLLVGFALTTVLVRNLLVRQFEERALAVARVVAVEPGLAQAVVARDPTGFVQQRAEQIRQSSQALFVVVTDDRGIRYSHPNPDRIGEEVSTDPSEALAGQTVVAMERGTLGLSARAKVPLLAADGAIVGEVSVGISADEINSRLLTLLPSVALYLGLALLVGVVASLLLARRLKRQTFGLELGEIAGLLQEREATLYGIREGVIAVDASGVVTLVNDEARTLLDLRTTGVGEPLADLLPPGRLVDLLTGAQTGADQVVLTERHCLVVNRMPVNLQGRDLGSVITLSDRTEQESLLRELDSVRGLTDALRAQQHEFDNRVHALAGLVELGRYDEALRYAGELSGSQPALAERLQERIDSPQLVGLLIAKSVVAAERGVRMTISDDSALAADDADPSALLTIVGNLVDNAIDAAGAGVSAEPEVGVTIRTEPDRSVTVQVTDTGRGVPATDRSRIFTDGFTTKQPAGYRRRGLGLALVQRTVARAGGTIAVRSDRQGAAFTVVLTPLGARRPEAARQ